MWTRYVQLLQKYPVRTNVLTAGIVGFTGDLLSQNVESQVHADVVVEEQQNLARALKVATWNAMVSGPLTHWFKFLDTKWPLPPGAVGRDQCLTVAKKVCLNQCTAAPLNNAGFYSWVLMWQHITDEQGDHSQGLLEDIGTKLTNDLPQTTVNSCLVWGTAWTINMLFLPPHTRVLFNSVGQVFWTAYLSFTGHRRL